ncbi:DUF2336 domain-containing protein [Methylobacterium planeticum]|uniref:DUF2336 domain-containing protein n=1 Tax=Methylobacterium planeticum TaxID=2615211 RepID=A0A6N6N126_9HYPH|nr:DUF2336 domain-containing protein [Methylobacterium planeticum]KAB1076272.1 DUF2336 domain-containing protein [Methylobacterium planeticum]
MNSLAELMEGVEHVVAVADTDRHRAVLRQVTDLLVDVAPRLSAGQVLAFDSVISRLVERAGPGDRQDVAERVSALPKPPVKVVRQLALDPAASVAAPVLRGCAAIPDDALVHLAQARGQGHLAAIALRQTLSERLAETIAEQGDEGVLRTLLGNKGARLSDRALALLSERVRDPAVLEAGLAGRGDVPPDRREGLLSRRRSKDARAASQRARPVVDLDRGPRARAHASDSVTLRVRIGLEEADILHWLKSGRILEALFALAHLAEVENELALSAHEAADARPMMLLVRAAGLRPATLTAFLRARRTPGTAADLLGLIRSFNRLSAAEARSGLRPGARTAAAP